MRSPCDVVIATIVAACTPARSSATSPATTTSLAYPLLDGRCDEYGTLAVERRAVAPGVELFVFQDRDYVWLCYTVPAGAFGALDLATPALAEPLNLHVSAQLAEWRAGDPDAVPKDAGSSQWWNQRGWTALPVPFNGTHSDGKLEFRPTPGRELQLGKPRFGRGVVEAPLADLRRRQGRRRRAIPDCRRARARGRVIGVRAPAAPRALAELWRARYPSGQGMTFERRSGERSPS